MIRRGSLPYKALDAALKLHAEAMESEATSAVFSGTQADRVDDYALTGI